MSILGTEPPPALDTPPRTRAEQFWRRLLLKGQKGPEVLKWLAFGRRLMLTMCALILVVGAGLTALSAYQMERLVERSLRSRGTTIAEALARAAFVPLTLEDRRTLRELVYEHRTQVDVIAVTIKDASGVEWAGYSGPPSGRSRVWRAQALIRPPRRPDGAGSPLGRVEVTMSGEDDFKRLTRLVVTILAVNGLFIALLLLVGIVLIRNLTINLQALVDEARWATELRRSNLQLEEFAYVASHDLQSPLRKVAGFAELLRERSTQLDAEAQEFISIIVDGTRRMQRLIEDLLTYSHVGSEPVKPVELDLGAVLREVLSDLEPTLKRTGAEVTSDRLPTLRADRRQMGQLLQNLLENAVKFRAEAPPKVHVSARREGTGWQVSVRDNGIGMDPKHAEQIFKMFRRLHPAQAYEGTGIGLAVARKIVERHGGRIWVESQLGRGATFRFTLPTAGIPPPPARTPSLGANNEH